jgi:hypothetical protein
MIVHRTIKRGVFQMETPLSSFREKIELSMGKIISRLLRLRRLSLGCAMNILFKTPLVPQAHFLGPLFVEGFCIAISISSRVEHYSLLSSSPRY